MRHLAEDPIEVALLASGVVGPAILGRLVPLPGPAEALFPAFFRAFRGAVDLPMIAITAQDHLKAATLAAVDPEAVVDRRTVLAVDSADEMGDPWFGSSR